MLVAIGNRAWQVLKTALADWNKHDCTLLSAGMAYYAAFSLFPGCLVVVAGLGMLARWSPAFRNAQAEMLHTIAQTAGPWLAQHLEEVLHGVADQASVGGPIGIATLVIGSLGVFTQFDVAMGRIWASPVDTHIPFWRQVLDVLRSRLVAFLILLGGILLIVAVSLAGVVAQGIRKSLPQIPMDWWAWQSTQTVFTVLLDTLILALLYRAVPKAKVRWRHALGGALAAALIWQLGQRLLEILVIGEKYSAYGIVGSFIALMAWIYYSSTVLLLGGELVHALAVTANVGGGKPPERNAID